VLLMRTMSKFGLAGVRIGYMMGRKRWWRSSTSCGRPTTSVCSIAKLRYSRLSTSDVFAVQAGELRSERARIQAALAQLPRGESVASDAT
jgi:histidinol-phosphate aminotransferase